jgi:hypothetical protein
MPVGLGGSMPQLNRSGETPGPKALFHSVRDIALIKDKTIQAGYGALKSGTIMATNAVTGDLVPYTPVAFAAGQMSRAYLVTDFLTGDDFCYVTIADSYKLAVGDSIVLANNVPLYDDTGSFILAIDRTTEPHRALVTFTTAIAVATFTTALAACVYSKSGAAGNFSDATFILDQDVFTGEDENAIGANTSVLISNAILYTGALINFDAAAATSLGTISDGFHTILK